MNNNFLNNKRERTKENKEILITLEKIGTNSFKYFYDTLQDRTKIKIPIFDEKINENNYFNYFEKENLKNSNENYLKEKKINSNIKIPVDKFQNNSLLYQQSQIMENKFPTPFVESKMISPTSEEIPLLQKYVEKNMKQPIIIPSCTQWFDFNGIHEIETKTLPEFFCGVFPGKTPEIYKEYRNYMINLYRENTNACLSSSSKKIIIFILYFLKI